MGYSGGKFRTAGSISKIIYEFMKKNGIKKYIEPFCGMCSVAVELVKLDKEVRVECSDLNDDLIFLLEELKNEKFNEMPTITREMFDKFKSERYNGEHSVEKSFALLFCVHMCVCGSILSSFL